MIHTYIGISIRTIPIYGGKFISTSKYGYIFTNRRLGVFRHRCSPLRFYYRKFHFLSKIDFYIFNFETKISKIRFSVSSEIGNFTEFQ
jgi:hypothetical protein